MNRGAAPEAGRVFTMSATLNSSVFFSEMRGHLFVEKSEPCNSHAFKTHCWADVKMRERDRL